MWAEDLREGVFGLVDDTISILFLVTTPSVLIC